MVQIRDIIGFPAYAVTSDGDVLSWWRANRRTGGSIIDRTRAPRVLRGKRGGRRGAYRTVVLSTGTEQVDRYIHRLVLEAFVGPCPDGQEGRHLDGDPTNNALSNLAYGTWADNHDDKERHGRVPRGVTHGKAVLTEEIVLEARRLWRAESVPLRELMERFGVSRGALHDALTGQTWTHLDAIEAPHRPGRGNWQKGKIS